MKKLNLGTNQTGDEIFCYEDTINNCIVIPLGVV